MRILLRSIATLAALSVLATVAFCLRFGARGFSALQATGVFGILTIAGWLVTIIAGPIAAVQLFRLRNSGRLTAIVLYGTMLCYYTIGLVAFRAPDAPVGPVVWLCVGLASILGVLVSPPAKAICVATHVLRALRG